MSYWERNKQQNNGSGPTCPAMEKIFGVKSNTILSILKKYKQTGSVQNAPRGNRKGKTNVRQDRPRTPQDMDRTLKLIFAKS